MLQNAIILSILASILSLEYMNGHFGFSRPLVTGTLTGLLLGDLQQGIIVGASLQLIFMGIGSVGAAVPPDQTIGSLIATAFAILSKQGTEVALTLAIPVAVAAQSLDILGRSLCTILIHLADKFANNGAYKKISYVHYSGILITFTRVCIIVFPAIYFGVDAVKNFITTIPESILHGLEVSGGMLPAVGFGMLLTMLNIPHLFPFFFIGFSLAIFGNFSTIGVTIVAICIAIIIDYYKKDSSNNDNNDDNNNLNDLDKLITKAIE